MYSPLLDTDHGQDPARWWTQQGSDSAMLDNTLEFLMMSGMDLPQAVMITIPEPWQPATETISRDQAGTSTTTTPLMMEPWDGPAAILFSDGDVVGAVPGPQRPAAPPATT